MSQTASHIKFVDPLKWVQDMYKICILYKQQEVSKNVSLFFFGPYMMKIHKFTISRELYIILIWLNFQSNQKIHLSIHV